MIIDSVTVQICSLLKRLVLVPYTILLLAESALNVAIPLLMGMFINALVYGNSVIFTFAALCGAAAAVLFLDIFQKNWIQRISRSEEQWLQNRLLEKFQAMKPAAVDEFRTGEIAMKFFRDVNIVGTLFRDFYPRVVCAVFCLFFAIVAVLFQNTVIACLYILFLPFMFASLYPYEKKFHRVTGIIRTMFDQSMNQIFEFMHVFPYLKSISAEKPYAQEPRSNFARLKRLNRINDRTNLSFELSNRTILFVGEYLILGVAGYLAWKKVIRIGDVVFLQILFLSVLNAFSSLFQLLPMWGNIRESICSVHELLDSTQLEDSYKGVPFQSDSGDICISHVSFGYPKSERMVFNDFSCYIHRGSIVVVTGANGAGKTTLLKLITGCLEPVSGKIEISGRLLCEWRKTSFREKIASVFQDVLLITGTIRDNITLKNDGYTLSAISEVLKISGADSLVERMPDGLEHRIGFEGGGLSGGERQKIAIARALIRKPEILIFDEVTNHLDYDSRCKMKVLLNELRGKTTVLLVSHDLEMIALCDQKIDLTE